MFTETTLHPDSFLVRLCRKAPLINTADKELVRQIPFLRWDGSSGRKVANHLGKRNPAGMITSHL